MKKFCTFSDPSGTMKAPYLVPRDEAEKLLLQDQGIHFLLILEVWGKLTLKSPSRCCISLFSTSRNQLSFVVLCVTIWNILNKGKTDYLQNETHSLKQSCCPPIIILKPYLWTQHACCVILTVFKSATCLCLIFFDPGAAAICRPDTAHPGCQSKRN